MLSWQVKVLGLVLALCGAGAPHQGVALSIASVQKLMVRLEDVGLEVALLVGAVGAERAMVRLLPPVDHHVPL